MTLDEMQEMFSRPVKFALAFVLALASSAEPALASDFALGTQVGTTGIGGELQYRMAPKLVLRGTVDWLSIGASKNVSAISYGENLKLLTGGAFFDWHPFRSWLLLSGGAYFGQREINLNARLGSTVTIDGTSYTLPEVGALRGTANLAWFVPTVGLGLDNTFIGKRGLGFKAMIGVGFGSTPSVGLNSIGGTLSEDATLLAHLVNERALVRRKLSSYEYYPILSVGVTYEL
jgi:hypothetical protein